MRETDRDMVAGADAVTWLSWDEATMQGTLLSSPERAEIPENIEVQLIVEFFSR